jgi:hypothetical protein
LNDTELGVSPELLDWIAVVAENLGRIARVLEKNR